MPSPRTEFVCIALRDGDWEGCGPLIIDTAGRIGVLARWLIEDATSSYEHRQRSMDGLAAAIHAEIVKATFFRPLDALERVRAFMRDHPRQAHTVEALARMARMSKFHFIRTYKQATGRTPMQDLRLLRVEAACNMLLTTDLPLKTIARDVGFCDEYYFSRVFRHDRLKTREK